MRTRRAGSLHSSLSPTSRALGTRRKRKKGQTKSRAAVAAARSQINKQKCCGAEKETAKRTHAATSSLRRSASQCQPRRKTAAERNSLLSAAADALALFFTSCHSRFPDSCAMCRRRMRELVWSFEPAARLRNAKRERYSAIYYLLIAPHDLPANLHRRSSPLVNFSNLIFRFRCAPLSPPLSPAARAL